MRELICEPITDEGPEADDETGERFPGAVVPICIWTAAAGRMDLPVCAERDVCAFAIEPKRKATVTKKMINKIGSQMLPSLFRLRFTPYFEGTGEFIFDLSANVYTDTKKPLRNPQAKPSFGSRFNVRTE